MYGYNCLTRDRLHTSNAHSGHKLKLRSHRMGWRQGYEHNVFSDCIGFRTCFHRWGETFLSEFTTKPCIVHHKFLHFVNVVGGGQLSSHQKFSSPLVHHFAPNGCDAKSAPHSCLAQVELIRITSSRIKELKDKNFGSWILIDLWLFFDATECITL